MGAMKAILESVKESEKVRGVMQVSVTLTKSGSSHIGKYTKEDTDKKDTHVTIGSKLMLEVLEFCLSNAISKVDGKLILQYWRCFR